MSLYAFSFDSASPFAGFDSGSGSLVTGRHGNGCNPNTFLEKTTASGGLLSSGLAFKANSFNTEILGMEGLSNTAINPLAIEVEQIGDGRLFVNSFSPNTFSLTKTPPLDPTVLSFGRWYFLELKIVWVVVVTASLIDPTKSRVQWFMDFAVWLNNKQIQAFTGSFYTHDFGLVPNAVATQLAAGGSIQRVYSRYSTIDDWYMDDGGTVYGDSYVHSDDATVEQVASAAPRLTQMVLEVGLLPNAAARMTQQVLEVGLLPNSVPRMTQQVLEVGLAADNKWRVYEA